MRTLSVALAFALLAPGLALADSTPAPAPSAAPSAAPKAAATVKMDSFAFVPAKLSVHVGDAVRFVNDDDVPHDATADDGSFASPELSKGQSWVHVFTKGGTFTYVCNDHPFMHATITVSAAAASSGASQPEATAGY